MAERQGFEPWSPGLPVKRFSRPPHSTALPPLRIEPVHCRSPRPLPSRTVSKPPTENPHLANRKHGKKGGKAWGHGGVAAGFSPRINGGIGYPARFGVYCVTALFKRGQATRRGVRAGRRSTIGNRVCPKRVSRVQIPASPPFPLMRHSI